ncbi:MAG: helix-turn-helix domain-containing protein [Candidatus Moranbacteria bacterium]|jgi:DNA-binding MarR family transcriptional regulator|nr:helix-turn-helix domain-containing protein [Candidatus Moranbacteria bacterium]
MKQAKETRKKGSFPADDMISPILHAATRIERLSDRLIFEPLDLSFTAFKILKYLAIAGPSSPGAILECLGGTKSNLSQRLGTLERKGLVERLPSKSGSDRRFAAFALTAFGKRKLRTVETRAEKEGLRLSGYFSKSEITAHAAFFKNLLSLLDQAESNSCTECDSNEKSKTKHKA